MQLFQNSVLKQHLSHIDEEIDMMVYELYGLSDDEIVLVKRADG